MNKEMFLNELKGKLKRLPKEEVDNIIAYYLDYFQDAEKDEAEVLKELDSPSTIASQILSEYAFSSKIKGSNTSNLNKIMLIVLSIFAAPIALPLAIAFVAVLFSMLVVIGVFLFSFALIAISLFFAGVVSIVTGSIVVFQGPATGILYIGLGIMVSGFGLLVIAGTKALTPKVYKVVRNMTMNFLKKFNKGKLTKRGNL